MDMSILLALVLLSIFVLSAFILLKNPWASPKEMEEIPDSLGWPIVGESFSFISSFSSPSGIFSFMNSRQKRHGEVFKSFVLGRFTVFMTERSKQDIAMEKMGCLLQTTGEAHKRIRRLIAEPLSIDGLKNYFQFINMLAVQTLDQWPGRTVLVLEEASTVSFFHSKVIGNTIMSLEPTGEEQEKLRANFKLISSSFASLPFKIPGTAFYKDRMYAMLDSTISKRRNGESIQQDFLESLVMKHSKGAGGGDAEEKLIDSQLKDNILTMLVAGHDTTTVALTWLIKFLGENPTVLEQLREEHREIQASREDGEYLTWSEVNRYNIKKGWSINLDVVSIYHDPEVFPNPQKFDPSRFDALLRPFSYLGFGNGPRMCPGINLAKLEICIFIHYLVYKYNQPSINSLREQKAA
ncbi:hypothetical protein I3842_16G012800 [Carya illinoinensis]|uniref:Cytochrome P450 n=1 Tax=Carya illinoinensis TaxID=32201 RepID=A0A921ZZG9_CARIL|nr:hypothetical protein I3842_16G012800 [Carya illinoinensis]